MYVCKYIYMYVFVRIFTQAGNPICRCIFMSTSTSILMLVLRFIFTSICVHLSRKTHIYIHTYTYIHTHLYSCLCSSLLLCLHSYVSYAHSSVQIYTSGSPWLSLLLHMTSYGYITIVRSVCDICIYVYIYVYIYIYISIYIYCKISVYL